ncbi:MAG: hypothetical protein JWQ89_3295 [Devosia sp.]|uniref:hypothetical protein n=1 Tax=Devosia sp. TaxID=1871048 RepID=UPI002618A670|nr:hypothetical protein [Devosia sp.]MDB5541568.1 hypothetical protein [Devosia sp.]
MSTSMNYVTVYKDPERDEFLASSRNSAPIFDKSTKAWIVTNPDLCRELLGSANLVPALAIESQEVPGALESRLGSLAYACQHIPLCHTGDDHASLRRRLSEHLASRRPAMAEWMAEALPLYVEPFRTSGRVDVVNEVLDPLIRGMMQSLAGIPMPTELDVTQTSRVFDKFSSLSRRTEVAGLMTGLHRHVREMMGPEASEDDVGLRLGLVVIGHDATVGTFGESLVRLLSESEGRPLNQIAFRKFAPQTGVPFAERIVQTPFSAAGVDFEAGQRLRLVLQTFAHSPPEEHHRFFGVGAHSCLGRPASTDLWSAFGALLGQLSSRVRVLSYELTPNNYIFNVPSKFLVEVMT